MRFDGASIEIEKAVNPHARGVGSFFQRFNLSPTRPSSRA